MVFEEACRRDVGREVLCFLSETDDCALIELGRSGCSAGHSVMSRRGAIFPFRRLLQQLEFEGTTVEMAE
jgi:hypothetical protein